VLDIPTDERLHRLDVEFASHVEQLHAQLVKLLECSPFKFASRPKKLPSDVIYLFSDGNLPFYIGRSRKFSQRLGNHCREGSQPNQSSAAYKLACESLGFEPIMYAKGSSATKHVKEVPGLAEAFSAAKKRMAAMDIRYVAEPNPVRQALLEIYCAVALKTRNSWKTS